MTNMLERSGDRYDPLLAATAWLIRPLIRALIRRGVRLGDLVTMLKGVLVEVAVTEVERDGVSATDSRVSLLTGVHRRDIRSLRQSGRPSTAPPPPPQSVEIIARWLGDPRFLNAQGQPLDLPRSTTDDHPSFDQLIDGIVKDIRPRTVLDDLLAKGMVQIADNGLLRLVARGLIPQSQEPELIDFLGANLHDHIAAAATNLEAERPQFFERAVFYSGVDSLLVDKIESAATQGGMHLLGNDQLRCARRRRHHRPEHDPSAFDWVSISTGSPSLAMRKSPNETYDHSRRCRVLRLSGMFFGPAK